MHYETAKETENAELETPGSKSTWAAMKYTSGDTGTIRTVRKVVRYKCGQVSSAADSTEIRIRARCDGNVLVIVRRVSSRRIYSFDYGYPGVRIDNVSGA